jgi:hypothetical protein
VPSNLRSVANRAALEAARDGVLKVGQSGPTLAELGALVRSEVDAARQRRAR